MHTEVNFAASSAPWLGMTHLAEWADEPHVIDYGALLICRKGEATLQVNFSRWQLAEGTVITLFPNDVVRLCPAGDEGRGVALPSDGPRVEVEMLRYDASLLREASLQLEQTVYSSLREDRCRTNSPVVTVIVDSMMRLLRACLRHVQDSCASQIVLLQLKAFFVGYHDYLLRHPDMRMDDVQSYRVRELFNRFMMLVERDFRLSRDVAYYARLLHICPKYLTNIVRQVTHETPKRIIDHYTILQLKLALTAGRLSMKEIARDFHFSDVSLLNRYFRRHTGQLPLSLRGRGDVGRQR